MPLLEALGKRLGIMALSEKCCWQILNLAKDEKTYKSWLQCGESGGDCFENAIPLFEIEKQLVLNYKKSEIEDNLYFLQKRGYLIYHGTIGFTRVVIQLSESALAVIESGSFTNEEQVAFNEDLFDLKTPGWFGMKFNLGELHRRVSRSFK